MKKLFIASALLLFLFLFAGTKNAEAYVRVRSYFRRSTGTFIMSHYRTNVDHYRFNNWSSRGNYNPFTGRRGYKSWY